jgi:hypothetical protein
MISVPQLIRRLRRGTPIIVVSGLPRSGTSMAMKMLQAGGVILLTDVVRAPDRHNPEGYFEYERVKELDKPGTDTSWLKSARGKAVKIVSPLLTWLPETSDYQVVFMERDLGEVVASQEKMLIDRGEAARMDRIGDAYAEHLEQVSRFLAKRRCFQTLRIRYRDVLDNPLESSRRMQSFIERALDVDRMAAAVNPRLYRTRLRS